MGAKLYYWIKKKIANQEQCQTPTLANSILLTNDNQIVQTLLV